MSHLDPKKKAPVWSGTNVQRSLDCATWLVIHGFLSDGERERVHKRMVRWVESARLSPAPPTEG